MNYRQLIGFVLLVLTCQTGSAAERYYTFSGVVKDSASLDYLQLASSLGINIGDPVQFIFALDFDRQGSLTKNDGTLQYNGDYFADLLDGGLIDEVNGGYYNAPTDVAEFNYGIGFVPAASAYYVQVFGGSKDDLVTLKSTRTTTSLNPSDIFYVGATFTASEHVYGDYLFAYPSQPIYTRMNHTLTLTDISDTNPFEKPLSCVALPGPAYDLSWKPIDGVTRYQYELSCDLLFGIGADTAETVGSIKIKGSFKPRNCGDTSCDHLISAEEVQATTAKYLDRKNLALKEGESVYLSCASKLTAYDGKGKEKNSTELIAACVQ